MLTCDDHNIGIVNRAILCLYSCHSISSGINNALRLHQFFHRAHFRSEVKLHSLVHGDSMIMSTRITAPHKASQRIQDGLI